MRWIALLLILSSAAEAQRLQRFCSRTSQGRSTRGFACDSFAFFEAFPANGAGTNGACSTTAPTGAKGEALTFTRSSVATCTTGTDSLRTTAIADGALVELSANQPRVMLDSAGIPSLYLEVAQTNLLTRFIAIDNAAWANVGTPTLTTGQTSPFVGTYATSAVQIDDNDGAAFEGRSQAVTVSAGAAYTMHCYVKAGTLDQARLSLDGTTADITGLSATTWSIITVTDASSSGVSISAQILAGDATGDTGTIVAGGCQVETGSVRHSIIPTVGTTITRSSEFNPTFAVTLPSSGSVALSATPLATGGATAALGSAGNARAIYSVGANILAFDGTNNPSTGGGGVAGVTKRYWSSWSTVGGWVLRNETDANQATSAFTSGTWAPDGTIEIMNSAAGIACEGLVSRICVDPDTTRCR